MTDHRYGVVSREHQSPPNESLHSDKSGHTIGRFYLNSKWEEIDLTEVLGVGRTSTVLDENPVDLIEMLDRVGSWRHTAFQAYSEAFTLREMTKLEFDIWYAEKYREVEQICLAEKVEAIQAGTRSKTEQIAVKLVESRLISRWPGEWKEWQSKLIVMDRQVRDHEGLYKCIDKRGHELGVIINNMWPLIKKP